MSISEKMIHRFLISLVFSLFNWVIIDHFIVELAFVKYIFVELFLLVSMKFYIFTTQKLKI